MFCLLAFRFMEALQRASHFKGNEPLIYHDVKQKLHDTAVRVMFSSGISFRNFAAPTKPKTRQGPTGFCSRVKYFSGR